MVGMLKLSLHWLGRPFGLGVLVHCVGHRLDWAETSAIRWRISCRAERWMVHRMALVVQMAYWLKEARPAGDQSHALARHMMIGVLS